VEALAKAPVNVVSFTGSSKVGPTVASWAGGKRVVMELGGNGAVVVMDDADLDAAARTIVAHRFGSSGQRCTSCKRAVIHRDVYDAVRDRILSHVDTLKVGDPADEETDVGPLIDHEAADHIMAKLEAGCRRGARVLVGGKREAGIVYPTVVEDVPTDDPLFVEETFGPVLPLVAFSTLDEAVALVNATPFGLQAGVFTQNQQVTHELFRRLEVGAVMVNDGPGLRVEPIPFGGVKSSGIGHEGIRYAVEEFSRLKTLVI
jgi:acyl-CoA reductase-like NAD-dependent aldehyde dehydrogenase